MNVWIKRSLSTAAVAGGLFFAGAAVAHADTGNGTTEDSAAGKLSAPIELGSVDLGVQSESTSSRSSTVTHTDRKGTATSTKSSAKTQKSSAGLSTGKITADPAGSVRSVSRTTVNGSDDHRSGKASQHAKGSVQAPVSVGGLKVTGQHEELTKDSEKTTRSDKHGTSTSERHSVRGKKSGGSLEVGKLTLNPNGTVDSHRAVAGTQDEDGDSVVSSHSTTDAAGSLPVSFDGIHASGWSESYSLDHRKQMVADRRGSRTEEELNENASRTEAGLSTGRLTADPKAALSDRRWTLFQTDGDDRSTLVSDRATTGSLAAPFRFDGVTGFVSSHQASRNVRATEVADRHRTERKIVADESSSHQAIAGRSGAVTGHPALDFADHRSSVIARDDEDTVVRSDREGYTRYAFPYAYEGFAVLGDFGNASKRTVVEQVADQDGVTTRTDTDEQSVRKLPAYRFDGFRGAPQGDLELDRLAQLTQIDE